MMLAPKGDPHFVSTRDPILRSHTTLVSGLKTAVINHLHSMDREDRNGWRIAASFQQAVVDVLVDKTIKAAEDTKSKG